MHPMSIKPICVDLDGTLIRNDITAWSLRVFIKQNFFNIFRLIFWYFLHGWPHAKKQIARHIKLDPSILYYNEKFLNFLISERTAGTPLFLATGSDEIYANQIADALGIFDGVFASNGEVSCTGANKAITLCTIFGEKGFAYAGNSLKDVPVWNKCSRIILVQPSSAVLKKMSDQQHELFE